MNNQKFLPLGTVVLLKGATKRLMIAGYCAYDKANTNKAYDYCGCLYPEGVISSDQLALFDNSQIEKIFYYGFSDEEDKNFKKQLVQALNSLSNSTNGTVANNVNVNSTGPVMTGQTNQSTEVLDENQNNNNA
jgi:hypothetical protein